MRVAINKEVVMADKTEDKIFCSDPFVDDGKEHKFYWAHHKGLTLVHSVAKEDYTDHEVSLGKWFKI